MSDRTRVCFDTSAWSALLNREVDKDLESLDSWLKRIDLNRAILIVPAIVLCEAYAHPDQNMVDRFEGALLRSNVELIDISMSLAKAGGLLRKAVKADGMNIKTPDAIVVATANLFRADYLITCDSRHIVRMDGKYNLSPKIGLPAVGHDQSLFESNGI